MNIVLYDENVYDLTILEQHINNFFLNKCFDYTIIKHTKLDALLQSLNDSTLLFICTGVCHHHGIDIGIMIRQKFKNIKIGIISDSDKFALSGYKLYAECYLLKPIQHDDLCYELKKITHNYYYELFGFFDKSNFKNKLYFKDILYIEVLHKTTYLYMLDSTVIKSEYPLKYWLSMTKGHSFIQTHKSYIVNLAHIKDVIHGSMILENNASVPLSRHYKKPFFIYFKNHITI